MLLLIPPLGNRSQLSNLSADGVSILIQHVGPNSLMNNLKRRQSNHQNP